MGYDENAPVTFNGVVRCVKEYGAAAAAVSFIAGMIWVGTQWLDDANESHEKTVSNEIVIRDVATAVQSLEAIAENAQKERIAVQQRTAKACEQGIIKDRDWCLLEGYVVPPEGNR